MRKRFLLYALLLLTLTLFASAASVETSDWDYNDTEHVFSCDLNLSGADMDGRILAALFAESGQMKSVTGYPAADTVHLAVPGTDTTDYIRVFWTDSHQKPLAAPAVLRMRDNGKKAYEDFENSLRNSKHENLTQSGDPTRLLVSSSKALPWAEYGVENVIAGADNFYVLEFLNYADTKACKEALEKLPCVRYAVYDAVIKVDVDEPGAALLDGAADAPPLSWGVAETGIGEYAANLKERGLDKQEVIVAVVDTGVDSGHEFLTGCVLAGYDFWENDDTPQDEMGHGTHVAGTVVDCTPGMNVKIRPVRVVNGHNYSTPLIVYQGIMYAVAHGANVINLSLGFPIKTEGIEVIEDAIQAAIDKNITVVVAACNKYTDAAEYCPANIEECITVAAIKQNNTRLKRAEFSNYGKVVDIAAPGAKINSCIPGNKYIAYSGTSQAAPHVSAAAALLMCERGTGQTPYQIENTLKSAADPLPEDTQDDEWKYYKRDNPGALWTDFLGAGCLNARPFIGFYALLYADGEFVFQKGNTPNPDKTLSATYPVSVAGGGAQYAAWYDNRAAIRVVTFADTLQPRSTATWFHSCENLTKIRGLEHLDTSKVTDMSRMFANCTALTTLNLTALDTSGVTNTRQMFNNCTALETLDLTGWNTANVTNMADMFKGCTALKTVCASDSFKTDKVSNSTGMFGGCTALPNYDPAHTDKAYARINNPPDAPGYFTDKNAPAGVYAILYGDGELVFQYGDTPESGRTVTNTYKVDLNAVYTDDHAPWFSKRKSILVVNFVDKISPTSTERWFYECENLKHIYNIRNLDTANVTDMSGMFSGCSTLTALDMSYFDTSNVIDMGGMFSGCSALTTLDLSHFNTANVINMFGMFSGCSGLTSLDVSHFDTANVTDMNLIFYYCSGLTVLDLSRFNTASVTDMQGIFSCCFNLKTIYASEKFTTVLVIPGDYGSSRNMFLSCTALIGGNGTKYDSGHTDKAYARIDGGADAPGYFTLKDDTANLSAEELFHLGEDYFDGKNGKTQDYQKSRYYYELSAQKGNMYAINDLGYIYQKGYGVSVDYAKALQLYEQAADMGNPHAVNNLGYMYEYGLGVTQDFQKAKTYYEQAANAGSDNAAANLIQLQIRMMFS
ncbi:MAG: BspA family leucine-rich repeat surface protein [Oscillospiraceae bacterium]|nr:BspA family leucine-rich repeat surface protein [Oscillospiraceae bacterium]